MMGYFKPLRRKIGVLTLVLACLFTAGWVRSFSTYDFISIEIGGAAYRFGSFDGLFKFIGHTPGMGRGFMKWDSGPLSNIHQPHSKQSNWQWEFAGFEFGIGSLTSSLASQTVRFQHYTFPYWSIVTPLTLLSAWLLHSKPRTKVEPSISPDGETI